MIKKVLAVLTALTVSVLVTIPAFASGEDGESSFGAYSRVIILGVDGAGSFIEQADTPNFDRIFENGAVKYNARAEFKTVSAQNWGAMLTGVSYINHGFTNGSLSKYERTSDTEYPSIFALVRDKMPEAKLASVCNWSPINHGIIETDIGVDKINPGDDDKVTEAICDYYNAGNDPALLFVQFDSVDGAGHSHGNSSSEYLDQINIVDGYIGQVYDCLDENGLLDDALIIVVADHGHTKAGGHGGITRGESLVTLAVSGKTVIPGADMSSGTKNRDVAAIALYALGVEQPAHMTAVVPGNLFCDVPASPRPVGDGVLKFIVKLLTYGFNTLYALID